MDAQLCNDHILLTKRFIFTFFFFTNLLCTIIKSITVFCPPYGMGQTVYAFCSRGRWYGHNTHAHPQNRQNPGKSALPPLSLCDSHVQTINSDIIHAQCLAIILLHTVKRANQKSICTKPHAQLITYQ